MRMTRILRVVGLSGLALLFVSFAFVQIEQHLLRYRAERLLSDFQSLRLHKSTWADAQTLMSKWGAWGRHDGQRTASDCAYTIMLADPTSRIANHIKSDAGWRLLRPAARFSEFLGGKPGWLTMNFLVQDGIIWRSTIGLLLEVPSHSAKGDDYGYSLMLLAKASDSLHQKLHGPWVLGADDQLADHPNYKEGRPSGCEGCLSEEVTFTPYISPVELKQVTSYDLSCFTRFRFCRDLQDVLPVARDWHLYPNMEPAYKEPTQSTSLKPCAIPVFVRARDAGSILLVDAISVITTKWKSGDEQPEGQDIQTAKVRLIQILKGTSTLSPGAVFEATAWPGGDINYPSRAREQFQPGKRYVILAKSDGLSSIASLDFCELIESTPLALAQVSQGLAQNDALRRPEKFGGVFW